MELKLRKTGNSLATTWPKELLNRLNVGEGDKLYAVDTPHGILVTPYDPAFEHTMLGAADGTVSESRLTDWFKLNSRPL